MGRAKQLGEKKKSGGGSLRETRQAEKSPVSIE
jgi:hypothetical protein